MSDSIQEHSYKILKEIVAAALSRAGNSEKLANDSDVLVQAAKNRMEEIEELVKRSPKNKLDLIEEYKLERKKAEAEEKVQMNHCNFTATHRENAIGAYTFWAATASSDFLKVHQDEMLDLVYK